jgi:hypothetical protein
VAVTRQYGRPGSSRGSRHKGEYVGTHLIAGRDKTACKV